MSIEANKERLQKLLDGMQDCGITNAVLMFEMRTGEGISPHIVKIGSPMACLAMTEWAAIYQHEEVYEGLEVTVYYDDNESEEAD